MPSDSSHAKRQAIGGLIVAALLLGAGLLIQHVTRTDSASTKPTATTPSKATYEATVSEVEVRGLYAGQVTFLPSGRDGKVRVDHKGTESGDLKLRTTINQGKLTLSQTGSCISDATSQRPCEAQFVVSIPKDARIFGEANGAALKLEQLQGSVSLRNSGDVMVRGLSGQLELHVATGDISASGLTSQQVAATNRNGPVTLAFSKAPRSVKASSDIGDVTVKVPKDQDYKVQARSDTGQPSVSVPTSNESSYSIEATSGNGRVTVGH